MQMRAAFFHAGDAAAQGQLTQMSTACYVRDNGRLQAEVPREAHVLEVVAWCKIQTQ
jgi:hypothetical protein